MNENNRVLELANKLEGILRKYLECHYTDFGVKANDKLTTYDWKSPINFALGHKYAKSNNSPKVKEAINCFLGNDLEGKSIGDIVENYNDYDFNTENEAYDYIERTIDILNKILFSQ